MDKRPEFNINEINKADVYIAPMLVDSEVALRNDSKFPQNLYRKTFIGDKTRNKQYMYDNKIMLLYRLPRQTKDNITYWNNFESYLCGLPTYLEDYKADKFHRMFVYSVPEMWKEEYELFKQWKPSKFSELYKQRIKKFYGDIDMSHPVMGVLYKTEERFKFLESKYGLTIPRDLEASPMPYWDEEYYQEEYKSKFAIEPIKESN
jgi:hypothetical protein